MAGTPEYKVGQAIKAAGYITQYHFVARKTGAQLERLIGYKAGRLGEGWMMLYLTQMPGPMDFKFRGYSQMSGGVSKGHLKTKEDLFAAQRDKELKFAQEYDVQKLKQAIIKNVFRLSGSKRLVKVIPNKRASGSKDYPPGAGIPQWELVKKLSFKVGEIIPPDSDKWTKKA